MDLPCLPHRVLEHRRAKRPAGSCNRLLLGNRRTLVFSSTTAEFCCRNFAPPPPKAAHKGNAFAASELAVDFGPDRLNDNFAKFQFVAIYDNAERQDITDIVTKARASSDPAEVASLVKQGEGIVMRNALDVPIAFEPQLAAYDTTRVGGSPKAPSDACRPVDLAGTFIKKR